MGNGYLAGIIVDGYLSGILDDITSWWGMDAPDKTAAIAERGCKAGGTANRWPWTDVVAEAAFVINTVITQKKILSPV